MGIASIAAYVARAARFAVVIAAGYIALRALFLGLRRQKAAWGAEGYRLLTVIYLSSVVEITALRGAYLPGFVAGARMGEIQWVPLRTTLGQLRLGAWPFLYHVVGNIIWFMPLGALLPAVYRRATLRRAALAALCLSVSVEAAQWALGTGMPDVDDVILNTLGGALGYVVFYIGRALFGRNGRKHTRIPLCEGGPGDEPNG